MRKELPILICGLAGLIYFLTTFLNPAQFPFLSKIKSELDTWYLLTFAVAFAVGLINLAQVHLRKVLQRREGWMYSAWLLFVLALFTVIGLFTTNNGTYTSWMFTWCFTHPRATVYSLLVFYIASAAYRAFRIKTLEASVLLISAVIMMLGMAPIGEMLWSGFPPAAKWILDVPNNAGMRGITIAATLGAVATALRILVGIERGHLGGLGE